MFETLKSYSDSKRGRMITDIVVIGLLAAVVTMFSLRFDGFEWLYQFSRAHEDYEVDEFMTFGLFASVALLVFAYRRARELRREIAARKRAEERAHLLASVDNLTGLPNRRRLEAELTGVLKETTDERKRAFMILDLNRFKPVNDVYGHLAGDEVLVEFARRLSETVASAGLVARLGGDEFAVLTEPITRSEDAARLARRILTSLDEPVRVDSAELVLGVGIGIAVAPDDGTTASDLLRRADVALYRAKEERTSTFHFFEVEMERKVRRRSRLEADMRAALRTGSIHPHYQAIVRLGDGKIIGFEALARWDHPEFGRIEPAEFVAIAEDSGLISQLSSYLLTRACTDAAAWPESLILSFNISPAEIDDPVLVLRILKTLGKAGLDPHRLEIELTEHALVRDYAIASTALNALRAAGIRIALDDFGSGNSSLNHLRELHFDRLKIDRSFIAQINHSEEAAAMVRAILRLAQALNLTTTAEGIETPDQVGPLLADGCTEAQGYHFGSALPAGEVQRLLGAETLSSAG
jgi:diguanylate cyclase (GGDEF)-like protein